MRRVKDRLQPASVNVNYYVFHLAIQVVLLPVVPREINVVLLMLTLAAAASAATGAATVTITRAATGQDDKTTTFALTVQEAGSGGNVVWPFCPASGVPVGVAYADGDGDWVQATVSFGNTYFMQFDQDRGGVAYVVEEEGQPVVNVLHALREELQSLRTDHLCEEEGGTKTVIGSVVGLNQAGQVAIVSLGLSSAFLIAGFGNHFTLEELPEGPLDLIASRVSVDDAGETPSLATDRLIIRRDLNPADGETLPVLDFEGAEAFEPIYNDVTPRRPADLRHLRLLHRDPHLRDLLHGPSGHGHDHDVRGRA